MEIEEAKILVDGIITNINSDPISLTRLGISGLYISDEMIEETFNETTRAKCLGLINDDVSEKDLFLKLLRTLVLEKIR